MQYSQFFKTNCTHSIFRTINCGHLGKFPKSPIRPASSYFWWAPNLQWTLIESLSVYILKSHTQWSVIHQCEKRNWECNASVNSRCTHDPLPPVPPGISNFLFAFGRRTLELPNSLRRGRKKRENAPFLSTAQHFSLTAQSGSAFNVHFNGGSIHLHP